MNIYLLEQGLNDGFDSYKSCVVISENEDTARHTHPSLYVTHVKNNKWMGTGRNGGEYEYGGDDWVDYLQIDKIKVTLIGVALDDTKSGVVISEM